MIDHEMGLSEYNRQETEQSDTNNKNRYVAEFGMAANLVFPPYPLKSLEPWVRPIPII